jgi:HD-GYP domain-containing protein (c-di-GMP phosphodiesterase class II)
MERWNGLGYPRGIREKNIHLYARMIAVADAYDAMVSTRLYRKPLSHQQAVEELQRFKGIEFDPDIVDLFLRILNETPDVSKLIQPSLGTESPAADPAVLKAA